jgi:NifB/MoaA-like Fe-S oxidoreductase
LDDHGFSDVDVVAVENTYFGGNIKVAGLLTGFDLSRALDGLAPEVLCLVPDVCLSEGRFLDGLGLDDLPRAVRTVRTTGQDLRATLESVRVKGLIPS